MASVEAFLECGNWQWETMKRPATLVCVMALAACLWVSDAALLRQHQEVSRRLQNAQVVAPDVPDEVLAMTGKPMANTAATTGQTVAAATTAKTTGETTVGEPQASVPSTATGPSEEDPATDALDAQGAVELEATGDVEGSGVVGNEETTSDPPAAAERTTKTSLNVKGVSGLDAEVFGNKLFGVSNVQPGMTKGGKGWVSTPTDPVLVIEDAVPMPEPVVRKDDGSGEAAVSAGDTGVVPAIAAGTTGIAGTTGTATTPTSTATGATTTTAGTIPGTAPTTTTTTAVAVGTSTDPTVGAAIPGAGVLPAAAATPAMYCFGGYDGGYRNDFHEFNFETGTWTLVSATGRVPRPRYRSSLVVHKNSCVLFGGHDGSRHLNDVFVFDFAQRAWTALAIEGPDPIPRDSHVAVVYSSSMYIFGGSSGTAMNDFYELNMETSQWQAMPSKGPPPGQRFCHAAAVYDSSLIIFGGYDGSSRLNDFKQFRFGQDEFELDIPESTLIPDLRMLVNNQIMSDIVFIVEDLPIYAHKILCMRCGYFKAMLTGEMLESRAREIVITDIRRPIFLAFLEYLYSDDIDVSVESAMELFVVADRYGVDRLKRICERRMLQSLCVDNAASILHAADLHNASVLRDQCLAFMLNNFDAVTKTAAFEEMGRTNVDLVFELLKRR